MSETRKGEVARCTECWQRADTVELLPDARLDAKGVCGYCRRVGIQSPTPPEQGEVDHAERLWANALHGDRDEWLAEVRALLARVAPQGADAAYMAILDEQRGALREGNISLANALTAVLTRLNLRATPPAAETGEPVAKANLADIGKALIAEDERTRRVEYQLRFLLATIQLPQNANTTLGELCREMKDTLKVANDSLAPAVPAPREVSEAVDSSVILEAATVLDDGYNVSLVRDLRALHAALSAETGTAT